MRSISLRLGMFISDYATGPFYDCFHAPPTPASLQISLILAPSCSTVPPDTDVRDMAEGKRKEIQRRKFKDMSQLFANAQIPQSVICRSFLDRPTGVECIGNI